MKTFNLFVDILGRELGISVPDYKDVTISSPFRSDSNPSFRVYRPKDAEDWGSAYDFGTGKSYTPVTFIMELKGLSYHEAVDYIAVNYGIQLSNNLKKKDGKTKDIVRLFKAFDVKPSPLLVEQAIIKDNFNQLVEEFIPSPIEL